MIFYLSVFIVQLMCLLQNQNNYDLFYHEKSARGMEVSLDRLSTG